MSITITMYCRACDAQNRVPVTGLYQGICHNCASPLTPATPEILAREALSQSLDARAEAQDQKKAHKRDAKHEFSRGPSNSMLKRITKK